MPVKVSFHSLRADQSVRLSVIKQSFNIHTIFRTPGKLQEFINDLHSGKLHREYHNGPDPTEPPQIEVHQEVVICLILRTVSLHV